MGGPTRGSHRRTDSRTSVLDFAAGTLVSFASNEKQLVLQRGTFEVEERVS